MFLLIYPFGPESKGEAVTESPNIGILYVISYVKARLPEVEFYYLEPFLSMKEHIEKIGQIKPDVYAISHHTQKRTGAPNDKQRQRLGFENAHSQEAPTQLSTLKMFSRTPKSMYASLVRVKKLPMSYSIKT